MVVVVVVEVVVGVVMMEYSSSSSSSSSTASLLPHGLHDTPAGFPFDNIPSGAERTGNVLAFPEQDLMPPRKDQLGDQLGKIRGK